jgi:hypothetical protein
MGDFYVELWLFDIRSYGKIVVNACQKVERHGDANFCQLLKQKK